METAYQVVLPESTGKILVNSAESTPPGWELYAPTIHPDNSEIPNHLMSLLDWSAAHNELLAKLGALTDQMESPADQVVLASVLLEFIQARRELNDLLGHAVESWEHDPWIRERITKMHANRPADLSA